MLKFATPLALILAASLIGCRRDQPAPPKPGAQNPAAIKPFLVKTNKGIDHEFFREVSLEDFLKTLPPDSLDSVELIADNRSQVFALVKVPEQPGKDLAKVRFETTFKTQDGQVIDKRWDAGKDRKPGTVMAMFCLPSNVVDGETKVVFGGD